MRQRPKQASYVQKMDNQRQVSAAPRQTSAPSAPAKREGRNVAAADSGGKMTKFMNIDSIPDGIPTSPHGHDGGENLLGFQPPHSRRFRF